MQIGSSDEFFDAESSRYSFDPSTGNLVLKSPRQSISERGASQTTEIVGTVIPPEGSFLAILVDSLGGNDTVIVNENVQKSVWVDAGPGNDIVNVKPSVSFTPDKTDPVSGRKFTQLNGTYSAVGITLGSAGGLVGSTNSAAQFSGGNVSVPDTQGNLRSDKLSIEAPIKLDPQSIAEGAKASIVTNSSSNERTDGYGLYYQNGRLFFYLNDFSGGQDLSTAYPVDPVSGQIRTDFIHVAATYDRNEMRIYFDGEQVASKSLNSAIRYAPATFRIGSGVNADYFRGVLDEVAFYPRGLTSDDIMKHFQAARTSGYAESVLDNSPVGYWRFAETNGTTANDSSGIRIYNFGTISGNYEASGLSIDSTVDVNDPNNTSKADVDVYRFELSVQPQSGDQLSIAGLTKLGIAPDLRIQIFADPGLQQSLTSSASFHNIGNLPWTSGQRNVYYVTATSANRVKTDYKLNWVFASTPDSLESPAPNDSASRAYVVNSASIVDDLTDLTLPTSTRASVGDWFKLDIGSNTDSIALTSRSPQQAITIALLNASGLTVLTSASTVANGATTATLNVSGLAGFVPGSYIVRVTSTGVSRYDLKLAVSRFLVGNGSKASPYLVGDLNLFQPYRNSVPLGLNELDPNGNRWFQFTLARKGELGEGLGLRGLAGLSSGTTSTTNRFQVQLFDSLDKLLKTVETSLDDPSAVIDLAEIAAGTYRLRISGLWVLDESVQITVRIQAAVTLTFWWIPRRVGWSILSRARSFAI